MSNIIINLKPQQTYHLLLDIWGVITPHSFRTDLYCFLEEGDHLSTFLKTNYHSPKVERFLAVFVVENMADRDRGYLQLPIIGLADCCDDKKSKVEAIVKNLRLRLQLQQKDPSLVNENIKALFNLVWMDGYKSKCLRPHAFLDVLPAFHRWASLGLTPELSLLKLHSFASGPPENQALFLAASEVGDLATGFISSYFDASSFSVGLSKKNPALYRALLTELKIGNSVEDSGRLVYLTDSTSKGKAARQAGLAVFIVRRPGSRLALTKDLKSSEFTVIDSLEQLNFTTAIASVEI